MFLIIERDYKVEVCRQLSPTELIDCAHHAERWGHAMGVDVDTDNPCHTVLGADIDVTIQPTKKPGAVHVWQSRGFYLKPD